MIRALRRLFANRDGSAAVEAAIFAPIFALLTFGVTDLGTGMFARMQVNAAVQAGAAYAIVNKCGSGCLSSIQGVMNDAAGNSSFCTATTCTASLGACAADASTRCIVVTASYTLAPLLPNAAYVWGQATTVSSAITVRIS